MNVLLLGVGMQGKATLDDLFQSDSVARIIAADQDIARLDEYIIEKGYQTKVTGEHLDATDRAQMEHMMSMDIDVVIDQLPTPFSNQIAPSAIKHGVHVVNTVYATPEMHALSAEAEKKDLTILAEFGLDPGIDLVLLGEAIRQFDRIDAIMSYGGGFPEEEAANNAIRYKVSWSFEGVLRAYCRSGRVIRNGEIEDVHGSNIFDPVQIHVLDVDGFGPLEAYVNGDVVKYVEQLGLDPSTLHQAGRYAMRWPGHTAFWKKLVDLHLLDDEPVEVDGIQVNRHRFLANVLEPHLQYGEGERDVAIVRVEVTGLKEGKKQKAIYQVLDYGDLTSGLSAMSRTVGYPASIGAILIGTGELTKRGLVSPMADIPYDRVVDEFRKRGIQVTSEIHELS